MDTHTGAPHPESGEVSPSLMPREAAQLDRPLTLRDGASVRQRAIRPDDAGRLQALHARLSRETIVFRFFGALPVLADEFAGRLSNVDYDARMAVVATIGEGVSEEIIAVARYQTVDAGVAEMALAVEDRWQEHGIGHQLLWSLASYARRRGFATFIAVVMYENEHMLALLRHSGLPTEFSMNEGRVEARIDITDLGVPTPLDWQEPAG